MKKDIILEKFLEGIEILKKIRETNVYVNKVIDDFLAGLSVEPEPEESPSTMTEEMKKAMEEAIEKKKEEAKKALGKTEPAPSKRPSPFESLGSKSTGLGAASTKSALGKPSESEFAGIMEMIERMGAMKSAAKSAGITGFDPAPKSLGEIEKYEESDVTPAERPYTPEAEGTESGVGAKGAKKDKSGRLHAKVMPF